MSNDRAEIIITGLMKTDNLTREEAEEKYLNFKNGNKDQPKLKPVEPEEPQACDLEDPECLTCGS